MALVLLVLAVALDFLLLMTGLLKSRGAPMMGPLLAELMDKGK